MMSFAMIMLMNRAVDTKRKKSKKMGARHVSLP